MINSQTSHPISTHYDFILAGGGMAALSLAYYLSNSSLSKKSVLIIDKEIKNKNDHTYCFWEIGDSRFESVVNHKWNDIWFHGTDNFSKLLNLERLNYKMIRGIDFYNFVQNNLSKNPNISHLQADILEIIDYENTFVKTSKGDFSANEYIFDSISVPKFEQPKYNNLLQHFKGWFVETDKPFFNINEPTLFDFRIEQKDELRFVYVLPINEKKALIEFTIFSDSLLTNEEYDSNLRDYIQSTLKTNELMLGNNDYTITETEYGVIPMSDESIDNYPSKKVIKIGTAGGYVKASTGYSFQRTQVYLQKLVKSIEYKLPLPKSINKPWKGFLDSVLLNVMKNKRADQSAIFTLLFSKNNPATVLRFLSEESTFYEDLKLMNTVPKLPFIKSAVAELFKRII